MTPEQTINLFCLLEDIQEQLLIEMKPDLRHAMKHWAGKTIDSSRMFIRSIDRTIVDTDGFGSDADELREMIEKYLKQ